MSTPAQQTDVPLTDADRIKINQRLQDLARLERDVELACNAKVPLGDEGDQCKFLRERLQLLKATYFPSQP